MCVLQLNNLNQAEETNILNKFEWISLKSYDRHRHLYTKVVTTVALPMKNDLLLSSGISLKRLTEITIPASFQLWSKAPRTVLSFALSDQLCALTPDDTAWSGSPTGMTALSSAHTITTLS